MVTLDRFTEEHRLGRMDFVKVDIEGSEDLFLAGATQTPARFRPVIMIELNPGALARFGATPGKIIKRLFVYVGVLSYSLYLWQQPFLNRASTAPTALFPVNLCLAFGAAVLSYHLVERPLLDMRVRVEKALFGARPKPGGVPASAAASADARLP